MQEANFALKAPDPHSQKQKPNQKFGRLSDSSPPKMLTLPRAQPRLTFAPTKKSENTTEKGERQQPAKADLFLFFWQ